MAVTFQSLVNDLKDATRFQPTPIPYTDEDYLKLVIKGLKAIYTDFNNSSFSTDIDTVNLVINRDFSVAEEEYILNCSLINFFMLVQQDVNTIVGYSTDSLSISNADKPYQNLANQIKELKVRNIELFPKVDAGGGM